MANEVEIVVKSTDRTRGGFDSARTGSDRLGSSLRRVRDTAAGFLSANVIQSGFSAITGFIGESTTAASDLNEALSKSNTVFGLAGGAIEEWASGAASSIGLAKGAALDAAGGFGNMFVQLGIGQAEAANMSTSITDLGADFASFHNADITEVLDAQSAAFRGEYDAVQRFVPLINAAAVEQKAMAQTGKENKAELTAQDKALATYALMVEGAGDAMGDFERTSDGAANSQRIAAAEMENAQAVLGEKLMPVTMALTKAKLALATILVEKIIPAFQAMGRWVSENKELVAAAAIGIMAALVPAFLAWAAGAAAAAAATLLAAAPFILIGLAVAALAYLIITHWDTIRDATTTAFEAVRNAIATAFNWVRQNWPLLLAILTGPIGGAVLLIVRHWGTIRDGFTAVKNWIFARVGDIAGFIRGLANTIGRIGSGMWAGLKGGLISVVNWIIDRLNQIIGAYNNTIGRLPGTPTVDEIGHVGGGGSGTSPGKTSRPGGIGGRAQGGLGSGLKVVGEHGRELVSLGAGGRVFSNADSENMLAAGGGGGGTMRLLIDSAGSRLDDLLVQIIRRSIRDNHGGDVQAALGFQRG
jgi:hypothetical protein